MAIWGEVAQAAGGLLSGVATGLFNANQAAKNRKFQERMYQRQHDDAIEFWKMQNDYALPSAELQRLKDAGLNPLLYYSGQNGGAGASAPALPSQPSGSAGSAHFENPFAGFGIMDAQRKALESNVGLNNANAEKAIAESIKAISDARKNIKEGKKIESETEFNIKSMESRLEQVHTQNRLNEILSKSEEWKQDEIKKNIEKADKEMEFVDNQIQNNTRMTDQQIAESKQRIENSVKITAQQIATMKAEERKALADAWLAQENARTESKVRDKILEKYDAEIAKAIAEGDAQQIENLFNAYAWEKMPAPGSATWKYQKWIENYVSPITSTIGNILGGAVAGAGAAMIRKR